MSTAPAVRARPTPPRAGARALLRPRLLRRRLPGAALAVVVALAVLVRLHSASALWLDEALSVEIARRPPPALFAALRRDGSPPLYYLLLHAWTGLLGTGDTAVRALSSVCALATLPLVWLAGRRLGGPVVARGALLLLAVSPFAVRYATEARMYALVQLLAAAGLLALLRALERPTAARLVPVAGLAGLLALTHYWTLFLLAATAAVLTVLALRGPDRRAARRSLAALAAGGLLLLPWAPVLLFQVRHTGAPWAPAPHPVDVYYAVTAWAGGGSGGGVVLTLLLLLLALLAVAGRREGSVVVLGRAVDRPSVLLLAVAAGALALGIGVGVVAGSAFAPRYGSIALVPGLLLAARGLPALPPRARASVLVLAAVSGLVLCLPQPFSRSRTQAADTARLLATGLRTGDVVVYCPDQLGPAVSRLLPPGTDQVVYPTGGPPALVDWVDYAQRQAAASPARFARDVAGRTDGAVWLVSAPGYRTFEGQCERLDHFLAARRGPGRLQQVLDPDDDERDQVVRFPVVPAPER